MLKIQKYKKMKSELNNQTKQILKKVTILYSHNLIVHERLRLIVKPPEIFSFFASISDY